MSVDGYNFSPLIQNITQDALWGPGSGFNQELAKQIGTDNSIDLGFGNQPNKGMTTGDMLNFGLGTVQTLGGMYYQNKMLGQQQQALDLNNAKFQELKDQRQSRIDVSNARAETARARIAAGA